VLVLLLLKDYPGSRLCGHRDLSPDLNHNGEIEPEEWVKQLRGVNHFVCKACGS
jgi:N-acetylmuramoyl-L-alanine amidase